MDPDRMMRSMMQGMGIGMPFGMFGDLSGGVSPFHAPQMNHDLMPQMLPHGFMSPMSMMMMDPFQSMQQAMSMANNGNSGGFSYCSSSVTSYSTDGSGRPQIYQQSQEVKSGPGGLKETKSAVRDSRTGRQELAIGHHLNEKAHIKKKSKNVYTGEEEQGEDFVNLEEEEAETFEQNWTRQARNFASSSQNNQLLYSPNSRPGRSDRLALTSSANEDLCYPPPPTNSTSEKAAMKTKKKKKSKLWKL